MLTVEIVRELEKNDIPYIKIFTEWDVIYHVKNSNNNFQSYNDLPAIFAKNSKIKEWYNNGEIYRKICENGDELYIKNGKLHRDGDLPARIVEGVKKEWYKNGKLFRDDDKPTIEYNDGSKAWVKNNQLHREGNLPAVIKEGEYSMYLKNGLLHRILGPALIVNGEYQEFWIRGRKIKREIHVINDYLTINKGNINSLNVNSTCPITLAKFNVGDKIVKMPCCNNYIDQTAYSQWISSSINKNCPLCRTRHYPTGYYILV